jgi:hypothetical protein
MVVQQIIENNFKKDIKMNQYQTNMTAGLHTIFGI